MDQAESRVGIPRIETAISVIPNDEGHEVHAIGSIEMKKEPFHQPPNGLMDQLLNFTDSHSASRS